MQKHNAIIDTCHSSSVKLATIIPLGYIISCKYEEERVTTFELPSYGRHITSVALTVSKIKNRKTVHKKNTDVLRRLYATTNTGVCVCNWVNVK